MVVLEMETVDFDMLRILDHYDLRKERSNNKLIEGFMRYGIFNRS